MNGMSGTGCPLCSGAARPLFSLLTRQFYRCLSPKCRLTFVAPQPTDGELERFYTEDYFGGSDEAHSLTTGRVQAQILERMLSLSPGTEPIVLDYGCARGGLWKVLPPNLRDRYFGIELDPQARHEATRTTGRPVFRTVEDYRASGSPRWDLCVMINVVEHLRDPVDEMSRIAATGAPGARIWVSTPNDRCAKRFVQGNRWDQYADRTHLHLFSHATLRTVLRASGFREISRLRFRLNYDHLGPVRSLGQAVMRPLGLDATLSLTARLPEEVGAP